MKKIIFAVAGFLIASAAWAQNVQSLSNSPKEIKKEKRLIKKDLMRNEVAPESKMQFQNDFPGASHVTYLHTQQYDKISFTNAKKIKLDAFYDANHALIGTVKNIDYKDVPRALKTKIASRFKGYTADKALFFDDNEANDTDMTLYESSFDDADNYFIEMHNGSNKIVVKASPDGAVSLFKKIK
ncbi:MAG: hypothetical protein ABS68_04895 [Niastella sp. SCN 39-18]|nr:hypothetical protein [Sphingobacteriales bacterium]ODT53669.1 MAG: hypothetical protein ABS68_04895 [Niastella sp. SCN 39-18]OJW09318.1 MAG: hypothetical protein BGO53_02570 [Sphingobacteriales bacterium 39-19]